MPFGQSVPWSINGLPCHVIAQPLLTAYLALNTASNLQRVQMIRVFELVTVLRHDREKGTLDWETLARIIRDTGIARFAIAALELAERIAPGTLDPQFRVEFHRFLSKRMRRVIDASVRSGLHIRASRSIDDLLLWATGPAQVTKAVASLLWPAGGWRHRFDVYDRRVRFILKRGISRRLDS